MTYKIALKDLFLEAFWGFVYFPVWWYNRGLRKTAVFCWQKIKEGWHLSGLEFFLVNFFKPMFGARGWDAYVLSIASHLVQVSWRFVLIILWFVFWVLIFLAWIFLPIIAVWKLIAL